jgi:hypothetical protein
MEKVKRVRVTVAVRGGKVALLGADGRLLCNWVKPTGLYRGDIADAGRLRRWRTWIVTKTHTCKTQIGRSVNESADPWRRKIKAWVTGSRLRGLDMVRPRGTTRGVRNRPRDSWDDAVTTMWHQVHNRLRRHSRSGWDKWCASVSNNSNKRRGARYGQR